MRKPLVLTDVNLDPVQPHETPGPCEVCEGEARWIAGRPQQARFFCAHCFLYQTDGGIRDAEKIRELVGAVEERLGEPISDEEGQVTRENADRILGSIVMMTRMVRANRGLGRLKKKLQEDE